MPGSQRLAQHRLLQRAGRLQQHKRLGLGTPGAHDRQKTGVGGQRGGVGRAQQAVLHPGPQQARGGGTKRHAWLQGHRSLGGLDFLAPVRLRFGKLRLQPGDPGVDGSGGLVVRYNRDQAGA